MSETLQTELDAIRTTAAIAPLNDKENSGYPARAFLRITGSDATRWLNGMVTNNIKDLAPGQGNYNFLLNAQGRIQGDCTIYREPNENATATYLLETDAAQIDTIQTILDKFIIMDDVELTPEHIQAPGLFIIGPDAPKLLSTLILPPLEPLHMLRNGNVLLTAPAPNSVPSYELYSEASFGLADATELSPTALEAHRILSGTPKFGQDIRDRDLPQETAQTHALHFAKGCYLGQEIVERIRSRGQVHRTFTRFQLHGQLPTLPAQLEADGKPAGELTSAIQIGNEIHAIGYLRREHATQPLTYTGGTATPAL